MKADTGFLMMLWVTRVNFPIFKKTFFSSLFHFLCVSIMGHTLQNSPIWSSYLKHTSWDKVWISIDVQCSNDLFETVCLIHAIFQTNSNIIGWNAFSQASYCHTPKPTHKANAFIRKINLFVFLNGNMWHVFYNS